MYKNIGKLIKLIAKSACLAVAITAVIAGIVLLIVDHDYSYRVPGLLICVAPVASYILSVFVYGYGELIDKVCDLKYKLVGADEEPETKPETEQLEEPEEEIRPHGSVEVKAITKGQSKTKKKTSFTESAKTHIEPVDETEDEVEEAAEEYVEVVCPFCKQLLSFDVGTEKAVCPYCDIELNIK